MNRIILGAACAALTFAVAPAFADDDAFADAKNGAKQHVASGFVCPQKIGRFERDAVGVRDPQNVKDYCAYSARDGVYGTIVLMPVKSGFDPKEMLAADFVVQEGTGGKKSSENTLQLGSDGSLSVYARTYDAAKIEAVRYRVLFTCAAVGNWAIEVVAEYGDPRDKDAKNEFLTTVYDSALKTFAAPPPAP
jgi:hypothetical protein